MSLANQTAILECCATPRRPTALWTGHVALDIDTPQDNSKTKKERDFIISVNLVARINSSGSTKLPLASAWIREGVRTCASLTWNARDAPGRGPWIQVRRIVRSASG